MRHLFSSLVIVLLAMPILSGCWDVRNIREMDYVSAFGIDFVDNEYIVYVQLVDLDAFSTNESGLPEKPLTTWIGQGKGRTIDAAVQDLYRTAEKRLFWGQLSAIVYSNRIIEKGIDHSFDMLNRYQEMRYHIWVYGTSEPIDELFLVKPFFNTSPLDAIFLNPEITYQQASFIQPLLLQELVRHYPESGATTIIPDLSLVDGHWRTQKETSRVLSIQGAYCLKPNVHAVYLELNSLNGVRWMNESTIRSQVIVGEVSDSIAALSLEHPRVTIRASNDGSFAIKVRLKGNITELLQQSSIADLEKAAEDVVKREIRSTYERGLEEGVDVYNLEHAFYRSHSEKWKERQQKGESLLDERSLVDIKVEVILVHTGKFDLHDPR